MKKTNHPWSKVGYLFSSAATLALTGCVTYVQREPVRVVQAPPPPPPMVQPAPPPPVQPVVTTVVIRNERDFDEPLTPYGEWVVVPGYGRCWRPVRVVAGWRPYADGHWERTDAGWYWVSEEPWAWATYHYGCWDWTPEYGWVWLPQTEWAPAWVAWREGAGYVGWAPLPPAARWNASGVVEVRDVVIAPRFVFVEERRLLERHRPTTVIVNNTTVVNKTVNITKIKVVNQTIVNEGPRPETVERASGQKVRAVAVRDLRHKDETEAAERRGGRTVPKKDAEPAAQTVAAPQPAVLPKAPPAVEAPVATKPPVNEPDNRRGARPARPERREPAPVEKKAEPAPQPAVLPKATTPEPSPAASAPVVQGTPPVAAKPAVNETDDHKRVRPTRPERREPPARVEKKTEPAAAVANEAKETPPAKHPPAAKPAPTAVERNASENKSARKKSDAREKTTGKPGEKMHDGQPESTNAPARPPAR